MHTRPLRVLIAMTLAIGALAAATWDTHGALRADGHVIRHADGTPFFWLGDTAWGMCFRLDRAQVGQYLDNRRAKGFTVFMTAALGLPGFTGSTAAKNPANRYGHRAFHGGDTPDLSRPLVVGGGTPTAPNDYWDHVDHIVDAAAARGLYIGLLPQWGYTYNSMFTTTTAKAYGRFIGERYRTRRNVIWVIGGDDMPATSTHVANYRAMAEGVLTGVTGATLAYHQTGSAWSSVFMTFHPGTGSEGSSSSQWFHADQWLDTNMYQSGGRLPRAYDLAVADFNRSPVKPTLMGEGTYEDATRSGSGAVADAWKIRRQAYHGLTGGSMGTTYGHNLIWDNKSGWETAMNRPGAQQMTVLRNFWTARPWPTYVPDGGIIASGAYDGSVDGGDDRKTAVRSTTGAECLVYYPVNTAAGIRLDRITTSSTVTATWWDPRNGSTVSAGSHATSAVPGFAPPSGWQDAVLLIRAATTTTPTNQAPTVSLTSPTSGASFTAPASITVSAGAADGDGSIAKVEFFAGSTRIGEDTMSPYSTTWSNVAAGSYTLTARATDNAGAATTSAAVSVTVASQTTTFLGINLNGPSTTIDGRAWSGDGVAGLGFSTTADRSAITSVTPSPAVDAATAAMLNRARWHSSGDLAIRQTVSSGDYQVYLWVMENHRDHHRSFGVRLEGTQVGTGIGSLRVGEWRRYGPYATKVADGALDLTLVRATGEVHLMGLEIHAQQAVSPTGFAASINFQPANAPVPAGYLPDAGEAFGARGNGLGYGWNAANHETRDRNAHADQRYDTFNHMQRGANPRATWEIAVPNGIYNVHLICGEPSFNDQINDLVVEGQLIRDPDGADHFDVYTALVEVVDGRLTIGPAASATNAKLCAVQITAGGVAN